MPEDSTPKTTSQSSASERGSGGGQKQEQIIRLKSLSVRNFKSLDNFSMEFKPPRMEKDLDILVIGSSNGLGKTSILEACSLLTYGMLEGKKIIDIQDDKRNTDVFDLMIRAGEDEAEISGIVQSGSDDISVRLMLQRSRKIIIESDFSLWDSLKNRDVLETNRLSSLKNNHRNILSFQGNTVREPLFGLTTDPLLLPPFLLYFHSYRKIQEGRMELGSLIQSASSEGRLIAGSSQRRSGSASYFKLEILRALMSKENLFEDFDPVQASKVIGELNKLLVEFAGVSIGKLRLSRDNTIDFRVLPKDKADNISFSFDSLSSGQKEIISTLFLIWHWTEEKALQKLLEKHAIAKQNCDLLTKLHNYPLEEQFVALLDRLLGGQRELAFDCGCWLTMVKGKHVLPTVINNCFRVKDTKGKLLQGSDRLIEVVKDLVRLPLEVQPDNRSSQTCSSSNGRSSAGLLLHLSYV